MKDGLIRLGACAPSLPLGDPARAAALCASAAAEASAAGVRVLLFPELCLTGYTAGDLLLSPLLLTESEAALSLYLRETADLDMLSFVGLPVAYGGKVYNCAAAVCRGELLGLVPKSNLPTYGAFYEARYFAPAPKEGCSLSFCGREVRLDTRQIFSCREMPALRVAAELCEDVWVPLPPSAAHAAAGATVILNLSANPEILGLEDARRGLLKAHSARLFCAYLYADAGEGESTTDAVYAGHCLGYAGGRKFAERPPFSNNSLCYGEADLSLLQAKRQRNTFPQDSTGYTQVPFSLSLTETAFSTPPEKSPFLPTDKKKADAYAERALTIQAAGLSARMSRAATKGLVLGISGGLDSTLALLASLRACRRLGLPPSAIHAVSMPGFGTSGRTRNNAALLCKALSVTFSEISIAAATRQHFSDIGHDESKRDVVYENAQARERTQILMDLANAEGALVVGTGDLSELALGFATYNGDHMSMYGVNASIPKTMVRALTLYEAERYAAEGQADIAACLSDIVSTPVSPELLPPEGDEIAQKTEELVGPYELHDFFLYYFVKHGFKPSKLLRYACAAFAGQFDEKTIGAWLRVFLRRFFSAQFKRSCLPDGPKVGPVDLSPRGSFRMPSDIGCAAFMRELDRALAERGLL